MPDEPPRKVALSATFSVQGMPALQASLRHLMAQALLEAVDAVVADEPPAVAARVREIVVSVAAVFETGVREE